MLLKSINMRAFILFAIFLGTSVMADRVVMTNNGPVQGVTVDTGDLEVEAFLGIPYAEPPVGRLRFQKPVPKTSWSGVYDASSQPPPCIQNVTHNYYFEPVIDNMTEDCLYLSLWVPYSKKTSKLKSIILFTHGGAFNLGSGNMPLYDGTNLAQFGDIIVVNLNYRIGVLGFFSAFTDDADGNMGIYDQILATRWIKDNAKTFGGDPDNIVLMGESAGAMILSGHLTSPLTKNLFKRMILQSGAATMPIILDGNARLYNTSQKLATLVGCADKQLTLKDNPRLVVQCLKRIPAKKLAQAEGLMKELNPITFFPRVGDAYLPRPFVDELREGNFQDTELLVGIASEEGPLFLTVAAPQYFGEYGVNRLTTVSRRFAFQVVRLIFTFTEQTDEKEIADYYINTIQNGTSDKYTEAIARSLGDYLIGCSTKFFAEFYSMRNPVYFYVFKRRPSSTVLAEWIGATHFDEIQYIFGNPLFENFTSEEVEFSRQTMARWVAFAKTGNPNVPGKIKWPLFTYDDQEYLELDDEESVHLKPDDNRCEFWRERFHSGINDTIISEIKMAAAQNGIPLLAGSILLVFACVFFTSSWMNFGLK